MSTALNKAIYARLTGVETPSLMGDALAAQSALVTLLGERPREATRHQLPLNLIALPLALAMPPLEPRGEAAPVEAAGEVETDSRATPMYSVRWAAL